MICLKWQVRFMRVAKEVSTWSKDPNAKIGAIIVDENKRILATGYNGFPKNVTDDTRLDQRDQKYKLIIHAEINALLNALSNGVSVQDSTLFVYGLPICGDCAKMIAQSGINTVVTMVPDKDSKWYDQWVNRTVPLFNECGIKVIHLLDDDLRMQKITRIENDLEG